MPRRIQLFNPSQPAEQPQGDGLPVGIEGNNPGNIKASGNQHPGQVGVIYSDRGTAFKLFRTMADGVAAQAELIMRYQESDRFTGILANHVRALEQRNPHYEDMQRYRSGMNAADGINNLAELIIVYAPPTDANRTDQYIEFVVNDVQRTLRQRAATLRSSGNEAQAADLEQKAANFTGLTNFNLREDPVLLAAVQEGMMKMEIGTNRFNQYVGRNNVDEGVRSITGMSREAWASRFSDIDPGRLPAGVDANPYGQTREERELPIPAEQEQDNAAQDMFGQTILGFLALLFAAMFNINPNTQSQTPAPNGTGQQPSTTTGQFADVSSVFSADSRRFFDTNGDGRVLANEVHYLFDDLNTASTGNIKIRQLDTNSNNVIDMDEAVRLDRDANGRFEQADVDAIRQMLRESGVTQTGGAQIPPPSAPVVQQR
jgi:hypothetical protein